MKRQVAGLGLLMALAATGGLAQAPADPGRDEPPAAASAPPDSAEDTGAAPDAAAPTVEPELAAEPDPAAAGSDDSPFDYQASEQISEDLSVSFPVDI